MEHKLKFIRKYTKSVWGDVLFIYSYSLETVENGIYNRYTIEAVLRGLENGKTYLTVHNIEYPNLSNEETLMAQEVASIVENEYFND
jgi:hypothetical protein